jgi:hypothetical protein
MLRRYQYDPIHHNQQSELSLCQTHHRSAGTLFSCGKFVGYLYEIHGYLLNLDQNRWMNRTASPITTMAANSLMNHQYAGLLSVSSA